MRSILVLMTIAGHAQASCPETTGDDATARALYQQGEEAYAAGRYDDALHAFTAALEHSGRAELYFNLANTYERMGDRPRAADALDQYLECAAPPDADLVRQRARRLRDTVITPLPQPVCTERTDPPDPILVAPSEAELDDLDASQPDHPSATPWLIAGGASLVLAAGLAYASTTTSPEPACAGCRTSSSRDWTPALRATSAVAATAAIVTTTIGIVTLVRF